MSSTTSNSQCDLELVAIVADNAEVEAVSEGTASLILQKPILRRNGGQVADHGQILMLQEMSLLQ